MYIPRTIEAALEETIRTKRKIIIVYGARQTGKTTLIMHLLKRLPGRQLIINADETPYVEILSSRDFNKMRLLVANHDIVFIDEAQRIPDIGINLKILYERMPELKIIASGSSSFELANRVREPLTGRTKTFHLYPIAVDELRSLFSDFEILQRLDEYLVFGMYPELFSLPNQKEKIDYLRELTTAYLYKDIFEIASIKYARRLDQLLRLLAYQIGSQVSIRELAQQLQMTKETVNAYIDLLEKAFVVFRLGGFSRNLRKEVTKMDKIYFWDVGVRNAVIDNFKLPDFRDDTGRLWENFVISERLKFLSNHGQYARHYFWRTYTGAELDLVEEQNGDLHGFEIKWNPVRKRIPPSWASAYPDATFRVIHRENFLSFVSGESR